MKFFEIRKAIALSDLRLLKDLHRDRPYTVPQRPRDKLSAPRRAKDQETVLKNPLSNKAGIPTTRTWTATLPGSLAQRSRGKNSRASHGEDERRPARRYLNADGRLGERPSWPRAKTATRHASKP
jgi:hypothetical protein